jgi:hypothetical protein
MNQSMLMKLSDRCLANQGEATVFFRAMLGRYRPGARVNESDRGYLEELLKRHPEYRAKVGCGVSHFEVMRTEFGSHCFRIVRTDGSGTDFSYRSCIKGRHPSRKAELSEAFRQVVKWDIWYTREAIFVKQGDPRNRVPCAVTGELLSRDDGHMDHVPPMTFEVIIETFLAGKSMSPEDVPIATPMDNQVAAKITDEGLCDAFRLFHARVARLNFVKKSVNAEQAGKNRIQPGQRVVLGMEKNF